MYDYEFVLLLQLAENLERFDAALIDSGGTPPEGSVTASCLRDLRLSAHADAFTGWVVNVFTPNLTLPALETFVLVYPAGWLDTEVHCLREVFERSQCPLKELRLPGSDFLDEWFKSLAIH
uniref:Uncharacterized protein n=1 Tax=Mycena chlorophos TaxID=658473 RepID=A0ABQ0LLL4_MYCCL|nr:predicted protein [Mycena chlorophos]